MNVVFPVEIPSRELMYKSILGKRLTLEGFTVYLSLKKHIPFLLKKLSPCVYFDKGYHPGVSEEIHSAVKKHGGFLVGLDEEGAVDYEDFSTIDGRYPSYVFDNYDLVFLWGARQYSFLEKQKRISFPGKVLIAGHPRFELLKRFSSEIFGKTALEIKKKYEHFILVNLNCGFGNNIKGDLFVLRNYGGRVRDLKNVIEYDKIKVKAYCQLIKKIIAETGTRVVLRPHPEEDFKIYRQLLEEELESKHCIMSNDHSVIPWIMAASNVIHPDCTTGVEAKMLGLKPISFLPDSSFKRFTYIPVAVSRCCSAIDNVLDILKNAKSGNEVEDSLQCEELDSFFYSKKSSIELIVNSLKSQCTPLYESQRSLSLFDEFAFKVIQLLRKKEDLFQKQKAKGFSVEQVQDFVNLDELAESKKIRIDSYLNSGVIRMSQ